MARSKYREERTIVRGVRRLPGEDRPAFRKNVKILRNYVEQFNVDVSEICQRLVGIRNSFHKLIQVTEEMRDKK